MKLGKSALLEIVELVREGLVTGTDVSEKLRTLDLAPRCGWEQVSIIPSELELTVEYVKEHPRAGDWEEQTKGDLN